MICIPPSNLTRLFNYRFKFWSKCCPRLGAVEDGNKHNGIKDSVIASWPPFALHLFL